MKLEQIKNEFSKFGSIIPDFEELRRLLKAVKVEFVEASDEQSAKSVWIYEAILQIHQDYFDALKFIYTKKYYEGWCKLERVEVGFTFLERHFRISEEYLLTRIKKAVLQLQCLYPYKLFSSMELLEKRIECTICRAVISPRGGCSHVTGEIYNGEVCLREITQIEILGVALVENPHHKYTVLFPQDEQGERIDYRYDLLDYWNSLHIRPFQHWDLVLEYIRVPVNKFDIIDANSECPCQSGQKYSECCSRENGILSKHYVIEYNKD